MWFITNNTDMYSTHNLKNKTDLIITIKAKSFCYDCDKFLNYLSRYIRLLWNLLQILCYSTALSEITSTIRYLSFQMPILCILGIIHWCKKFIIFAVTIHHWNVYNRKYLNFTQESMRKESQICTIIATQIGPDIENSEIVKFQIISSVQYNICTNSQLVACNYFPVVPELWQNVLSFIVLFCIEVQLCRV